MSNNNYSESFFCSILWAPFRRRTFCSICDTRLEYSNDDSVEKTFPTASALLCGRRVRDDRDICCLYYDNFHLHKTPENDSEHHPKLVRPFSYQRTPCRFFSFSSTSLVILSDKFWCVGGRWTMRKWMEKYESQEKTTFLYSFHVCSGLLCWLNWLCFWVWRAQEWCWCFFLIRYVKSSTLQFLTESYWHWLLTRRPLTEHIKWRWDWDCELCDDNLMACWEA